MVSMLGHLEPPSLRYVGVIWFLLHVLQLLPIALHLQIYNETYGKIRSTSPDLMIVIKSACVLIS